ncbi:MAG: ATP-binding protein [Microcoleaceae cyanobacterium]
MDFQKDFLNELANEKELTEAEKEVFIPIFGDDKNREQVKDELFISQTAINTRLTGIYSKFQISGSGPVKEKKLKDYLYKRYKSWQSKNLQPQTSPTITPSSIPIHPFSPLSGSIENSLQLFGRKREIRRIFELLNSGSSVALIGEEAIGKSSILQTIRHHTKTQSSSPLNYYRKPIYLDLGHVADEEDFYFAFCETIGIEEQKGFRLFRALKDYRLLLILDNVEKMAWDGFTNQVRSQIRALAEGSNSPLRLVVAARTPLNQLFPDSGMVSPFENICQEEIINRWDKTICRNFIISRLKQTSIQFSQAEIIELIEKSKGHPQQLMKLCYELYNRYQQQ